MPADAQFLTRADLTAIGPRPGDAVLAHAAAVICAFAVAWMERPR